MSTFRAVLEKTGDIVTIQRLNTPRPCFLKLALSQQPLRKQKTTTGAQQNWKNWDQTQGRSIWLPSTMSLVDAKQLLLFCPLFLTATLPHPDAHTGKNAPSSMLATILTWLLST